MSRKEYVHALVASVAGKEVEDNNLLEHELGFDSLDMVEIAIDIETEYKFDSDDAAVERWRTVRDVVDYSRRGINHPGKVVV